MIIYFDNWIKRRNKGKKETHIALWIDHAQRSSRVQRVFAAVVVAGAVVVAVVEGRHFLYYILPPPYVPFVQICRSLGLG